MAYYALLFCIDVFIIIKFVQMAFNYFHILEKHYSLNKNQFYAATLIVTTILTLTLFRFQIFITSVKLYVYTTKNVGLLNNEIYMSFFRVTTYISKFAPFLTILFVIHIVSFFAVENEDVENDDGDVVVGGDGGVNDDHVTKYDEFAKDFNSLKGSIKGDDENDMEIFRDINETLVGRNGGDESTI